MTSQNYLPSHVSLLIIPAAELKCAGHPHLPAPVPSGADGAKPVQTGAKPVQTRSSGHGNSPPKRWSKAGLRALSCLRSIQQMVPIKANSPWSSEIWVQLSLSKIFQSVLRFSSANHASKCNEASYCSPHIGAPRL